MARLRQLSAGARYRACEWDLKADERCRRYWTDVFLRHGDVLIAAVRESYPHIAPQRLEELTGRYDRAIRRVIEQADGLERIDILTLDAIRTGVLREFGVEDAFRAQKNRENAAALELLPALLRDVDDRPDGERPARLASMLLAGNLFDLGAVAALRHVRAHNADFDRLVRSQPPRPWLIDDADAWAGRWLERAYRHVGFFVDNAGADFCLGCLPLARWMAQRGTRVTLAANSGPALNDVTADEARRLLAEATRLDDTLRAQVRDGRIRVVASGGSAPLLDLAALSPECVEALADVDLLILHGMGRALESNYTARLACDTLRCAVVKDAAVARWLGGKVFDCVFGLSTV